MVNPEQERQCLTELYAQMSEGELLRVCNDAESLTEVARHILRLELERRRLDAASSDSGTADIVEFRKLIMIRRYTFLMEALLAKTRLDSAGIECFLADENIVRIDWFWSNLLGGVKLHVMPEDADTALRVLEEASPDGFEVVGVGKYERPQCPNCNSVEISFEELNKPVAYASMYLCVPIPLHRHGWNCHSCGHRWQDDAHS